MKKVFIATVGALVIGSTLTACSWTSNTKSTDEEPAKVSSQKSSEEDSNSISKKEEERIKRMEKGIFIYGEGVKGGVYLTTVNTAYSERNMPESGGTQNLYSVVVSTTIENVRDDGQTVDLSELKFNLNDPKTDKNYDGKILPDKNPSTLKVDSNKSLTLDVSFEVPSIENKYMFNVESQADPITDEWEITGLNKFNQ